MADAEPGKSQWRVLKTLSNVALVSMLLVWMLQWRNDNEFEKIINDPVAKEFWIETRHFYDLLGWLSIAGFLIPRLAHWTIEYVYDRSLSRDTDDTDHR